jgi:uncharacterized integral membrane protein
MNARTIAALVLLTLLLVFVFMNLEEARVWLFGIRAQMPIALVVLISGALGMGAGFLLAFVRKPREKKDAKSPT